MRIAACAFIAFGLMISATGVVGNPLTRAGLSPPTAASDVHKVIGVRGRDSRTKVPRKLADYAQGIGIIYERRSRVGCTAFCVGSNVIATNAHCLIASSSTRRRIDLNKVKFVLPARSKRRKLPWASLVIADPKQAHLSIYSGFGQGAHHQFQKDWAFALIKKPICKGHALDLGSLPDRTLASRAKSGKVFLIGFHGDKKMTQRWLSPDCGVKPINHSSRFLVSQKNRAAAARDLVMHTCDMFKGASGSPIFVETRAGAQVVAINAGVIGYRRYRVSRATGRRKTISSRQINVAVRARAFRAGLKRYLAEEILADPGAYKQLQALLQRAGFYNGAIDGEIGPKTRDGITRYERANGLARLGLPTDRLLLQLAYQYGRKPSP